MTGIRFLGYIIFTLTLRALNSNSPMLTRSENDCRSALQQYGHLGLRLRAQGRKAVETVLAGWAAFETLLWFGALVVVLGLRVWVLKSRVQGWVFFGAFRFKVQGWV